MSEVAEGARVSAIKVSRILANSPAVQLKPDEENRGAYHELYGNYHRPNPAACKWSHEWTRMWNGGKDVIA